MVIMAKGEFIDSGMESLESIAALLDAQLDRLEQRAAMVPDPDMFGVYDAAEKIYGLGFGECQQYLSSVYGGWQVEKSRALAIGRQLPSGFTVAQAVNHAANYWKHHHEWVADSAGKPTKEALEKLGARVGRDYVASCVMAALTPAPFRFTALLPEFAAWREQVSKERSPFSRTVSVRHVEAQE